MEINTNPAWVKKIQRWHLAIGIVVFILLIWLLLSLVDTKKHSSPAQSKNITVDFSSPLNHVNTEAAFIERTEKQVIEAKKAAEETKKQLDMSETSQKNALNEEKDRVEQLSKRLAELEKQLETQMTHPVAPLVEGQHTPLPADGAPTAPIRVDTLNLAPATADIRPVKTPETYVPSGTFVKAVMLGGADASAAVTSQSNPNPMLFRITDQGRLPNNRQSNLKDCMVTAAVSGDISSERGHIRLESLSCTRDNDEIVDIKVKGTVFGPEGKNGVRGKTLWREGALLQRAFTAGAFSGFSSALSQRYTTTSISPLGATQNVNGDGIWGFGAARGASNAMSKLADYHIKRAEQYHPVIQLSAGTEVDIVFLEGFFLDGRKNDDNHASRASIQPASQIQPAFPNTPTGISPLPLSDKQIQRLKERSEEIDAKPQFERSNENDE